MGISIKTIAEIAEEICVNKQAIHQKIKHEPLSTTLHQFTSMNGNTLHKMDISLSFWKNPILCQ